MKSVIIMAAFMALAGAVASVEARSEPVDVRKLGPAPWIQECKQCGGRLGCLKCINDVYFSSGKLSLARECKTCIHTANPRPCYKCIPNISFSYDIVQRAQECKICANQKGRLAEGCSGCLAVTPTLSHAYECKLCRSFKCFSCLKFSYDLSSAYQCKNLH